MSVAVAVLSSTGAGLATDSLRVELSTGASSTGYLKHVQVGRRVAAFTGLADWNGKAVADWVREGLASANSLEDIPRTILESSASDLPRAYADWRTRVGPAASANGFLEVVCVSTESGRGEGLVAWTVEESNALTMTAERFEPSFGSIVLAVGAVDDQLFGFTPAGRLAHKAAQLQRVTTPIPAQPDLPTPLISTECAEASARLVDAAIAREGLQTRVESREVV